jgi:hypothetical protein
MRQSTSTTTDASASPETKRLSQDDLKEKRPQSSKLGDKAKKKAWYSVIYPSYKSRSEDFKKLFNIPEDERLLVGMYLENHTKQSLFLKKKNNITHRNANQLVL